MIFLFQKYHASFPGQAAWLVKRVLEYGRWRDRQVLVAHYGKPRLTEVVTGLRSLQPKASAFCRP